MPMPALRRRWTVADLEDLPDDGNRYEIIDGELFVTPSPALSHQAAMGELYARLREFLARQPVGIAFVSPADITFSPTRLVQPDVFVVPIVGGRRPHQWADVTRLMLAVEVLSPSTARADRVRKRSLYREEGVSEYWIVDLEARTFDRSTPADPRVEVLSDELTWLPDGASEAFVIDLSEFFSTILDR